MSKILGKLDLTKIDKSRIENYEYTTKEGVVVKQKLYAIEIVELTSTKMLKEGDTWVLRKTHAIVEGQTKDERAEKKEAVFLGDGLQFENKVPEQAPQDAPTDAELADPSQIPF